MNRRRTGFTLVEVMFAVITLGIGLIMVAAVFPVAIEQRKLTSEESIAAATAGTGMNVMTRIGAVSGMLPVTGTSVPTAPPRYPGAVKVLPLATWNAICGNLILPSDPRVAWVPLYRRDGDTATVNGWDANAQIFIIGVQIRNASTFVNTDAASTGPLQPKAVKVLIERRPNNTAGSTDPYVADFNGSLPTLAANTPALGEGCYLIIANDNILSPQTDVGRINGHIYRLGVKRTDAQADPTASGLVYELAPGWEFNPDAGDDGVLNKAFGGPATSASTDDIVNVGGGATSPSMVTTTGPADAFIVGRGPDGSGSFGGPVMDVAAYTGFCPAAN